MLERRFLPRTKTSPTRRGERPQSLYQRFELFQIVPAIQRGGREDPHVPRFTGRGREAYNQISEASRALWQKDACRRREREQLARQPSEKEDVGATAGVEVEGAPIKTISGSAPSHWSQEPDATPWAADDPRRIVSTRMNIWGDSGIPADVELTKHEAYLVNRKLVADQFQTERERGIETLRRRLPDIQHCQSVCSAHYDTFCPSLWLLTAEKRGLFVFIPRIALNFPSFSSTLVGRNDEGYDSSVWS